MIRHGGTREESGVRKQTEELEFGIRERKCLQKQREKFENEEKSRVRNWSKKIKWGMKAKR